MSKTLVRASLVALAVGMLLCAPVGRGWFSAVAGSGRHLTQSSADSYPYRSARFDRLVGESYCDRPSRASGEFYEWIEKAYLASSARLPRKPHPTLEQHLATERAGLAQLTDPIRKAHEEIGLAKWVHAFIRASLPTFSLERGFEFKNAVQRGERQCFLQSVLAAGLLQRMGVRAGIVMVYQNERGEQSNNGHAVTLVKLSNGLDVIMDASHAEPLVKQQGLFARRADYAYVNPVFISQTVKIRGYRAASASRRISTCRVKALDYAFVRSQFYYYRGERAVGGLLASCRTASGLSASAKNLRESVRLCPKNPLAVYMLGRAYLCQGNVDQARCLLERANGLYESFGWVPAGAIEYLDLARRPASTSPKS